MILRKVGEVHIFKHRLYISALEQAKVVILSKYVLLGVINTIYKHFHAWVNLWNAGKIEIFWIMGSISQLRNMLWSKYYAVVFFKYS